MQADLNLLHESVREPKGQSSIIERGISAMHGCVVVRAHQQHIPEVIFPTSR